MKIYEQISIEFKMTDRLKRLVDSLEEIYKIANKLPENSEEKGKYQEEFYELMFELEVVARATARAGKISWDEFDALIVRYSF